jgi:hypothetical protein
MDTGTTDGYLMRCLIDLLVRNRAMSAQTNGSTFNGGIYFSLGETDYE